MIWDIVQIATMLFCCWCCYWAGLKKGRHQGASRGIRCAVNSLRSLQDHINANADEDSSFHVISFKVLELAQDYVDPNVSQAEFDRLYCSKDGRS